MILFTQELSKITSERFSLFEVKNALRNQSKNRNIGMEALFEGNYFNDKAYDQLNGKGATLCVLTQLANHVKDRRPKSLNDDVLQKPKVTVATHDGRVFHPDEILALCFLIQDYGREHVKIIRSRDMHVLTSCDYVLDVGCRYDDTGKNGQIWLDHHGDDGSVCYQRREGGIRKATCGMYFDYAHKTDDPRFLDQVRHQILSGVESWDNGEGSERIPNKYRFVFDMEANWDAEEEMVNQRFERALQIAGTYLEEDQTRIRQAIERGDTYSVPFHEAPKRYCVWHERSLSRMEKDVEFRIINQFRYLSYGIVDVDPRYGDFTELRDLIERANQILPFERQIHGVSYLVDNPEEPNNPFRAIRNYSRNPFVKALISKEGEISHIKVDGFKIPVSYAHSDGSFMKIKSSSVKDVVRILRANIEMTKHLSYNGVHNNDGYAAS